MKVQTYASACALLVLICPSRSDGQELSEAQVIEKFLADSPYAREARARAAAVRAEAAGRTLFSNPSALASREGAGYQAYFEVEQQLPISGRRNLLKQAGAAAVGVTEAESATFLWTLRTDLRSVFYRLVAAQSRESVLADAMRELESIIGILRKREQEGEGSRYDRLRAERELAEYRSQIAIARADVAQARSALVAFLPRGTSIDRAAGTLDTLPNIPSREELLQRALSLRPEFLVEQRQVERFRLEARAAGRLRIPEPVGHRGSQARRCGAGTDGDSGRVWRQDSAADFQ